MIKMKPHLLQHLFKINFNIQIHYVYTAESGIIKDSVAKICDAASNRDLSCKERICTLHCYSAANSSLKHYM